MGTAKCQTAKDQTAKDQMTISTPKFKEFLTRSCPTSTPTRTDRSLSEKPSTSGKRPKPGNTKLTMPSERDSRLPGRDSMVISRLLTLTTTVRSPERKLLPPLKNLLTDER